MSTDYKRVLWDHRGQGADTGREERRCGQDEQVRIWSVWCVSLNEGLKEVMLFLPVLHLSLSVRERESVCV